MKYLFFVVSLFLSGLCKAQVGIGTTNPHTSSILDITSTSQGLLPPRMSYDQREAILNPSQGLIIYCTNCGVRGQLQIFDGLNWTDMVGNPSALIIPTISTTIESYVTDGVSPRGPNTATNTGTGTNYSFYYVGTGATSYGPSYDQPIARGTYAVFITVSPDGIYGSATQAFAFSITGFNIGDVGLGGNIAYLLTPYDVGYDINVQHGLVSSGNLGQYPWYNGSYVNVVGIIGTYGQGLHDTNLIVAAQGNGSYAAKVCRNYNGGGFTDWFLPNTSEVYYTRSYGAYGNTWTSDQSSVNNAYSCYFSPYFSYNNESKATTRYVTAVRYF